MARARAFKPRDRDAGLARGLQLEDCGLRMDEDRLDGVRLDVWLDVACLFRTRSEAKRACEGGKVTVNGQAGKPRRLVRQGDQIVISRPLGRRQTVVVAGLADRSIPKPQARLLYEDQTPPPSPEEVEARRVERIFRAMNPAPRAPTKRDRREIRKMKGRDQND